MGSLAQSFCDSHPHRTPPCGTPWSRSFVPSIMPRMRGCMPDPVRADKPPALLPPQFVAPPTCDPSPGLSGFLPLRSILSSISVTQQRVKQLDTIQLVREQRETGKQELAYHTRPFVLCGIPLRRPPAGDYSSSAIWFALRPGPPNPYLGRNVGGEAEEPYCSLQKSRSVARIPATSERWHSLPPSDPGIPTHLRMWGSRKTP